MNKKNSSLPEYCHLIDGIITKIAEKHGRESEEVKAAILLNIETAR